MRTPAALLLIVCFLMSAASLVLTIARDRSSDRVGDAKPDAAALEARIRGLENSVRALEAAMGDGSVSGQPPGTAGASLESRLDALENSMRTLSTSGAADANTDLAGDAELSPRELDRTRRALDAIQREELDERISRWVERETKQSKEIVAALEKRFKLDANESAGIGRIFNEECTAQARMLEELWNENPPQSEAEHAALAERWERATENMRTLRVERDRALRELLGEERFRAYEHLSKGAPKEPAR